jgi:2-dehydropantoate 2-reductase
VELAGLTGVPAPALRHVHAAISLLDHTSTTPVPAGAH